MSKKNCTTDTDANRTVNRQPVKVMSEQDRSREFLRVMRSPKSDVFAQAKLERYFKLVREWEAGYTDEELESMPDETFDRHQARLRLQAGFTHSGEALETAMFNLQDNVTDTAPPAPQTHFC